MSDEAAQHIRSSPWYILSTSYEKDREKILSFCGHYRNGFVHLPMGVNAVLVASFECTRGVKKEEEGNLTCFTIVRRFLSSFQIIALRRSYCRLKPREICNLFNKKLIPIIKTIKKYSIFFSYRLCIKCTKRKCVKRRKYPGYYFEYVNLTVLSFRLFSERMVNIHGAFFSIKETIILNRIAFFNFRQAYYILGYR